MSDVTTAGKGFDDLLAANRSLRRPLRPWPASTASPTRGVAIVTCMDSRIDPLRLSASSPGDAKIFRNPGGRVTADALEALVLGTTCSASTASSSSRTPGAPWPSNTEDELRERVGASAGKDASWMGFHVIDDQERSPARGRRHGAQPPPHRRAGRSSAGSSTTSTPACSSPSTDRRGHDVGTGDAILRRAPTRPSRQAASRVVQTAGPRWPPARRRRAAP